MLSIDFYEKYSVEEHTNFSKSCVIHCFILLYFTLLSHLFHTYTHMYVDSISHTHGEKMTLTHIHKYNSKCYHSLFAFNSIPCVYIMYISCYYCHYNFSSMRRKEKVQMVHRTNMSWYDLHEFFAIICIQKYQNGNKQTNKQKKMKKKNRSYVNAIMCVCFAFGRSRWRRWWEVLMMMVVGEYSTLFRKPLSYHVSNKIKWIQVAYRILCSLPYKWIEMFDCISRLVAKQSFTSRDIKRSSALLSIFNRMWVCVCLRCLYIWNRNIARAQ